MHNIRSKNRELVEMDLITDDQVPSRAAKLKPLKFFNGVSW